MMSLTITDEVLYASRMTEAELQREVAVLLFQQEKITLARAASLAGMDQIRFQHLLASREIPIHYDVEDFESDIRTLRELGRL